MTKKNFLQSLKYRYFHVGEKLRAPTISQPTTTNRESSASSTLSDSFVVFGKAKLKTNASDTGNVNAAERHINRNLPITK